MSPTSKVLDIVALPEWGTARVECPANIAAQMHADGHVTVAPLGGHSYEIRAKHKVGVLRYGELELRISSKVPIARTLYLATHFAPSASWRELDALLSDVGDPLSAIGHALALAADRALRPAPLQGYVTHEESARQIRGRLLFDRQISARAGLLIPVEIRYDEYEVDIVENRVVKAALVLIERAVSDREPALARRLAHLRAGLDGVTPWRRGVPVPSIAFGRMNERYRAAFGLSRLVLEGRSLEFNDRKHLGTSFLFDMNKVFESYVETKLRAALEQFGGVVRGQERVYLDDDRTILMKPDITWVSGGRHLAVVDAKYKRSRGDDFPNADAYQMLAYCTRLGLRRGWLVYADLDGSAGGTSVVSGNGTAIVVRALDLDGTIDELEARVEALALEIAHDSLDV